MQAMTPDVCDNMPNESTMTLTDIRNGQDYRVRKMPDGKCWMIDNLKLELTNSTILTPADSNVSADIVVTLASSNLIGNFTITGYLRTDSNDNRIGSSNAWRQVNPSDPTIEGTQSCVARNFIDPASTTGCGYLYNLYTATAGIDTTTNGAWNGVASSICPANWHLPTLYELGILNSAMYDGSTSSTVGTTEDTKYVNNWWYTGLFAGTFSGVYNGKPDYITTPELNTQGQTGAFWIMPSLLGSGSSITQTLYIYPHRFALSSGVTNYLGHAVRCLS
jgi:uncharacterized protein (TIGR02145 family)